jgi:hypothetical protein
MAFALASNRASLTVANATAKGTKAGTKASTTKVSLRLGYLPSSAKHFRSASVRFPQASVAC